MMQEARSAGLADNDCATTPCTIGQDSTCESIGCGNCFQPPRQGGPMAPPPPPPRCAN
jgi:hypothetical protein